MFLIPLFVTVLLALLLSALLVRFFRAPLSRVLGRIIAEDVSDAWLRYMQFAILVVGVSSGVKVRELEKYIPVRGERQHLFDFSMEQWVVEIYRTVIDTLQGITWMLLVFFAFAMVAYVIVRIAEMRFGPAGSWQKPLTPATETAEPE